jgi:hypothetical protein
MIGPHLNGAHSVFASFTSAPVASPSGEAKYVNGKLQLNQGDVTVTITPKGEDSLAADWSFRTSRGGWSLRRAR